MKEKPKVVVIFPKYKLDDSSHFSYWYRIFEEAGKELDIKIIFESGTPPAVINNSQVYLQKIQIKPFNLLERFCWLCYLRLKGCKTFYTHYSLFGFFIANLITSLLGGKTYLWDGEYYEKKPTNRLLIIALKLTDVLVTGHQKIAEQYKKIVNIPDKDVRIVSSWIVDENDLQKQKIRIRSKKNNLRGKNILFIHHLSPRKGSRQLPEIIEKVLAKRADLDFTIVGDGPDLGFIKDWKNKNKFGKAVNLKGRLPLSEVKKEYLKADVFILPSQSEGFPRVILEAMKYGVPYVATDVGCVREISPKLEQEFIVSAGNSAEFADRTLDLLEVGKEKKQQIREELFTQAGKFQLKKAVDEFIKLFIT